jgi:hypothetical protein
MLREEQKPRWLLRTSLACAAGLLAGSVARDARADDVEAARQAYERGTSAYSRGDFAEAARRYATADELAPNPVTLESALKASIKADDAALGMTLVDRAERRSPTGPLEAAARRARAKFEGGAGKLIVRCADERPCGVKIDGTEQRAGSAVWLTAGAHQVEISGPSAGVFSVRVEGGREASWRPPEQAAPAPPPPALPRVDRGPAEATQALPKPAPDSGGMSPAWFWIAAGTTAALGGVSIWSGVDTLSKHDDFVRGNDAAEEPGRAAQTRTNVLLGALGAAAVTTGVLAIITFRRPAAKPPAASSQGRERSRELAPFGHAPSTAIRF